MGATGLDDVSDITNALVGDVGASAVRPVHKKLQRLAKHPRLFGCGCVAKSRENRPLPVGPGLLVALRRLEALNDAHDRLDEPNTLVPLRLSVDEANIHHGVDLVVARHDADGAADLLERLANKHIARRRAKQLCLHGAPQLGDVVLGAVLELIRRIEEQLVRQLLVGRKEAPPVSRKLNTGEPIFVELPHLVRALDLHILAPQTLDLRVDLGPGAGIVREWKRLVQCGERDLEAESELRLVRHLPRLELLHVVLNECRKVIGGFRASPDALTDLFELRQEQRGRVAERSLQLASRLEHVVRTIHDHVRRKENTDVRGFRAQQLDAGLGGSNYSLVAEKRYQCLEAVVFLSVV